MMEYPNINPEIIHIFGPISLRWYSLAYIFGIIINIKFLKAEGVKTKIFTSKKQIDNLFSYVIIGMILGARFFYTLVYNFKYYSKNFLDIFQIWEGGLSFHGGIIGIMISTWIFAKKNKLNPIKLLDLGCIVAPIGLFFGRIANFINGELYGRISECTICMIFPTDPQFLPRHPSQLYEGIFEGFILLIIMLILFYKTKLIEKIGILSGIFGILYSIFRFFIEFFREPDEQLGFIFLNLSMGQLISIGMLIISIVWIFYFNNCLIKSNNIIPRI